MLHDSLPSTAINQDWIGIAPCSCGAVFTASHRQRSVAEDMAKAKRAEHIESIKKEHPASG